MCVYVKTVIVCSFFRVKSKRFEEEEEEEQMQRMKRTFRLFGNDSRTAIHHSFGFFFKTERNVSIQAHGQQNKER